MTISPTQARRSPSERVLSEIARREGVEPGELPEPLYDAINPDALNDLFTSGSARVMFEYLGYNVVVTSDGDIRIDSLNG